MMKEAVKHQYNKEYQGKFSLLLEDGNVIDQQGDKNTIQAKDTLESKFINRFSTIRFINPKEIKEIKGTMAADGIFIHFPDYLRPAEKKK